MALERLHAAGGEPAERGDARAQSMLAGLLSLSAAWLPRARRRPRRGEIKTAIMAALAHVDYYEDRDTRRPVEPDVPGARSVGLPVSRDTEARTGGASGRQGVRS